MKIGTKLWELLNSQKSSSVLLANYIENLDRKYDSYMN